MQKIRNENNKTSVAFKYNYCKKNDAWFSEECSADLKEYHVEKRRRWCSFYKSNCYKDIICGGKGKSIDGRCYESNYISLPREAYSGIEKNGKTIHMTKDCKNGFAVMTTLPPRKDEGERCIFSIFYIKESIYENDKIKGVRASDGLYVDFTEEESLNFKFWNYYENSSKNKKWGCRMHRYLNYVQVESIIHDMLKYLKNKQEQDDKRKDVLEKMQNLLNKHI